ncbi:MAG: riboflavin synthase [Candidatus Omnitrophota bacterium]
MFTGIIKEVGKVANISYGGSLIKLGIQSSIIFKDAESSDSIAVNGVCLTLTRKEKDLIFFDVIAATFKGTNLKQLKKGDLVNLEPALSLGDKLGGHFVLGHVDVESRLRRAVKRNSFFELEIDLPSVFKKFIVIKGSVTVEGISLTVQKVLSKTFVVSIIPFTYQETNLKYKKPGSRLNIEFDYLLKNT